MGRARAKSAYQGVQGDGSSGRRSIAAATRPLERHGARPSKSAAAPQTAAGFQGFDQSATAVAGPFPVVPARRIGSLRLADIADDLIALDRRDAARAAQG